MSPQSDPNEVTATDANSSSASNQKEAWPANDLVGKLLDGRYLIEEELARGGIGVVYLARDKPALMSRRVVVKVLLEDSLKNEWIVQKFHQEVESLTRLDDPGILGIFDVGKLEDGAPYLVMQYVDGVSLRTQIRAGGMKLERVANITQQIGRTLSTAHENGIIHRDLKPENIMLRHATGGGEQVKVIDFGIAKVKNSVIAPSTVTGAGVAGTIGYMSPEQLQAQKVTTASDVYALGAIAYEMLTGVRPFNPETAFQLLEMQRKGVRVSPKDLRPGLSAMAAEIILKALACEPSKRYQNAREFGERLASAITGETSPLEVSTLGLDKGEVTSPSTGKPETPATAGENYRKKMELAHVLFMDIVGYSKLPIDHQTQVLRQLQDIVKGTQACANAQSNNQLIRLPTGDGMALVFFSDPEAPVRCALGISKALKSHPEIRLRMGVHSGPVNQIIDVNESVNVAGAGINMAQRVMDCGDTGHIVLSKRMADDLGEFSQWQPYLHDLGETEVKHGVRMHIVNFYLNDVGNSDRPEKFKKQKKALVPVYILAAVFVLALIGGVLALWRPWNRNAADLKTGTPGTLTISERAFTYYLTPSDRGKTIEEERFTGNEQFRNGSKFRFVLIPEQSGALYLLDTGAAQNRAEAWYVLFPTPRNNQGSSQVNAGQPMEARIEFDNNPGNENLSIIWSAQPIPELEAICKEAAKTGFEIKDVAQVANVKEFLSKHGSQEIKVEIDPNKNQTTVRGGGDILIRKLVLKHFDL